MLALFTALCLAVNFYWPLPLWFLGVYGVASMVTYIAYAIDKSAAKAGRWRTSENTVLLLGLLGGWPGSLITQQLLHQKRQKHSFRVAFWATVWATVLVFVVVSTPVLARLQEASDLR
ncbi:uncharacterized membrane protein YsdA (DUF1294 family) [Microterricola gilva]|uniref:Uncharacterized membrane protein YsdA (DUF1294 family) n=1 Tax=Microterricola gilva TaxID=393267 RepID=A0A4Q8AN53_9MICO|nr:DUF1294 domain-containing protein [Microterricola gilva]RZU66024.1 uncharacterized membrane protein YsdA (DUF1294 family) [Microterricola gilva]